MGFARNDSEECKKAFFVRLEDNLADQLGNKVGLDRTVGQSGGFSFVITRKVTIKAMHEAIAELRRGGHDMFFAEMKEEA